MYITKCTFLNFAPEGRTETLQLTYIPQILAAYIQYKYIYYKMYVPSPCSAVQGLHPKNAQKPSNLHISPNCW